MAIINIDKIKDKAGHSLTKIKVGSEYKTLKGFKQGGNFYEIAEDYLRVDIDSFNLPSSYTVTEYVNIYSSSAINLISNVSWLSAPFSESSFKVVAEANSNTTLRTGTLTLSNQDGLEIIITVIQQGSTIEPQPYDSYLWEKPDGSPAYKTMAFTPRNHEWFSETVNPSIRYASAQIILGIDTDWTITSNVDWCKFDLDTNNFVGTSMANNTYATYNNRVFLHMTANTTGTLRSTNLVITHEGISKTITVNQKG